MEWAFRLEKEKMGSAISQNVAVLRQWTGVDAASDRRTGRDEMGTNDGGKRGREQRQRPALARVLTVEWGMSCSYSSDPQLRDLQCLCLPRPSKEPIHFITG